MSSRTETELGNLEGGRIETKRWRNVVRQRNRRTETKFERTMITGQKVRERQGKGAESQRMTEKRCETQRMAEKRCGKPENDREKVRKTRQ
jgi:hypothetical protein